MIEIDIRQIRSISEYIHQNTYREMKGQSLSRPTKTSLELGRTILKFSEKGDLSFPNEWLILRIYVPLG